MKARYKEKRNTKRSDLLGQQTDSKCALVLSDPITRRVRSSRGAWVCASLLCGGGILAWAGLRNMGIVLAHAHTHTHTHTLSLSLCVYSHLSTVKLDLDACGVWMDSWQKARGRWSKHHAMLQG
ncbi:hypothetical protein H106_03365 [Trichophyton rubrum CBS 735.88]|nr:hypothetical protein H106_03365 [Trichophyton rubrum CBS 735.88]